MEQSFIAYIENSIKENWDLDALTDYNGATLQYKDVARKIEKVHLITPKQNYSLWATRYGKTSTNLQ